MNLLTKQEIETWIAAKETAVLSGNQIGAALHTALDALARLEDAEAAQALVVERAAEAIRAEAKISPYHNGMTVVYQRGLSDGFEAAAQVVAALASPSGVAALAALRAERDAAIIDRDAHSAANRMTTEWLAQAEAEVADLRARLAAAEGRVAALTEAGRDRLEARVEAVIRRNFTAPEDTAVEALCLRFGYGAVMDAASRLWARSDMLGAFYIGGCIGFRTEEEARAALATVTPPADTTEGRT